MNREDYGILIRGKVEERARELVEQRIARGEGFLRADVVLRQDPFSFPRTVSNAKAKIRFARNTPEYREYLREEKVRRAAYRDASMRFRLGDLLVEFPAYTYKPPLHRRPRSKPFTELPLDYFKIAA